MASMGVVQNRAVAGTDVIDMERCGVRQGPGNLEGSDGFRAAAEEARFAPHVFPFVSGADPVEVFKYIVENKGMECDAVVIYSSSTFGVDNEAQLCPTVEAFKKYSENQEAYMRVPLKRQSLECFKLFAPGVDWQSPGLCRELSLYGSHETAVTNNHFDINGDGLIIQLRGRKRVTLFPPQATKYLRRGSGSQKFRRSGFNGDLDNRETVNEYLVGPYGEDWQKACNLGITVDIGPGEILAIPMFWWHAVKSLDKQTFSIIVRLDTLELDTGKLVSRIPFAAQMLQEHPELAEEVREAVREAVDQIRHDPATRDNVNSLAIMEHVKRVSVVGLQSKPQLNGQSGKVMNYHEPKGRYVVQLDSQTVEILIKPANLNHGELLEDLRLLGCLDLHAQI